MKLLKIKDNLGYFLGDSGQFELVDKIRKEDLLRLVDLTLSNAAEFDEYDENSVKNQAHQIIYKSILEKLKSLGARRDEFIDESARLFLTEYEKYKKDSLQQGA